MSGELAVWTQYMDAYLEWKRNPVPPEQYHAVVSMGGFNPDPDDSAQGFRHFCPGFNPSDPSGGYDVDGAPWGVHPYWSASRPAWVNWELARALFWEPWRVVRFLHMQVGMNQGHLGGPVGARHQQEAEADGMVPAVL